MSLANNLMFAFGMLSDLNWTLSSMERTNQPPQLVENDYF